MKNEYDWGTGYFRDIATIRRRVYTDYYTMVELYDTLREIILADPAEHCFRLFEEIESPAFNINALRYEEIKSYLWERSKDYFGQEIILWENKKNQIVCEQGSEMLLHISEFLGKIDWTSGFGWKRAIAFATAWNLFDVLERKDVKMIVSQIEEMIDFENTPRGVNFAIDFSEIFFHRIIQDSHNVVVLAGDINSLCVDLKIYAETLLCCWIERIKKVNKLGSFSDAVDLAKKQGLSVTFLVNENFSPRNNNKIVQRNAVLQNVEDLIELEGFSQLKLFQEAGLFEIKHFSSKFSGTVLSDLDDETHGIIQEADAVIALGEQNNLTVNGLNQDCFRFFLIRDFASVFYTGIRWDKEDFCYPHFVILFAPANVLPAIDYAPDILSKLTAKEYYLIYKNIAENKWHRLVRKVQIGGEKNLLKVTFESEIISSKEKIVIRKEIGLNNVDVLKVAQEKISKVQGAFVRVKTEESLGVYRCMHMLRFPQTGKLELGVLFSKDVKSFQNKPKTKITFDDVLQNVPEASFGFNFLYFITRNIILKFNKASPHFILGDCFCGESIDFLKTEFQGESVICPPLYNKGAIGIDDCGGFVFGRIAMPENGIVEICIDNEQFIFKWTCVNPLGDFSKNISIFTPREKKFEDKKRMAQNFFGTKKMMHFLPENCNYNFVMVNDSLLGVVMGSTEIPPFGTILSVPQSFFSIKQKEMLDRLCREVSEKKKLVDRLEKVKFRIELPEKWKKCKRIMGGALLMVNDGEIEDLVYKPQSENSVYEKEGWVLDSSQRTQETSVEENLREARSVIGLTDSKEVFLAVFDGRANNRTGATHEESVRWIQEYFATENKKIEYAFDLDGASSVALGVFAKNKFYLLNQTARGSDSKFGGTRYYNHIAYLISRE